MVYPLLDVVGSIINEDVSWFGKLPLVSRKWSNVDFHITTKMLGYPVPLVLFSFRDVMTPWDRGKDLYVSAK